MKRKLPPPPVDLIVYAAASDFKKNHLLFDWLGDDERRGELYEAVNAQRAGVLKFPSLARDTALPTLPKTPPDTTPGFAYLITSRVLIEQALRDPTRFSNSPYVELGSGSFMLALDEGGPQHARRQLQMAAAGPAFHLTPTQTQDLCAYAFRAAAPMALRTSGFDLADLAEQAALRFCAALYGYPAADYPLLEDTLRRAYRALNHQILGRHFLSDPLVLPEADAAMARLLARTSVLIGEYALGVSDRPEDLEDPGGALPRLRRVMAVLAEDPGALSAEERAVFVVGAMVGSVGNVQASVCIAMQALLANDLLSTVRPMTVADRSGASLWPHLAEGLRLNPPVAFLPRRVVHAITLGQENVEAGAECILAIGGATRGDSPSHDVRTHPDPDPLIFGLDAPPGSRGLHWCLGKHLAEPLIQRICAEVLRLPSLAERLHPVDGLPIGLEKLWGFRCLSYPLQHRRDLRVAQQSLNVVMRIKTPSAANAEALRSVIRVGAPRIEAVLRESRHVHFAWFEFIDNDSKLVLHTVFDGDFNAYLQHFALVVGDVFDRLFRYVEDGPPLPVSEHPNEFVDTIRRFHRPPAEGFFFSAYPRSECARIMRWGQNAP